MPMYSRDELLAAPLRKWNELSIHLSVVYLVPTGELHDSGYGLIAIVGETKDQGLLFCACCDDVTWDFPLQHPYDDARKHKSVLHTNAMPDGTLRMWASSESYFSGKFKVGMSLSSTTIEVLVEKVQGK